MNKGIVPMNSAAEIKDHYGNLQFYINGEWTDSRSSTVDIDTDPATGEGIAELPTALPEEV